MGVTLEATFLGHAADRGPTRATYHVAMGRGSKSKVRWKNDRVKKHKERAKRTAREKGEARKG